MPPTRDQLRSIVTAAVQAPSADNCHRVRFEPAGDVLRIWSTSAASAPEKPPRRTLDLISCGALVENATLKAAQLGFESRVVWFPDPSALDLVCELHWQPTGSASVDELADAIEQRHTNRSFFHGPPLSSKERSLLCDAAGLAKGVKLIWFDAGADRSKLLRLILKAEAERFRVKALHNELFSAIRFDLNWNETCPEGLPPGSLGIERLLRAPFTALRHWPLMRAVTLAGGHWLLALRAAYLPCRMAPHLAVLTSTLPGDQAAIAVGQTLQRLWLQATLLKVALQPMAASTVLALENPDPEGASERLSRYLREGWSELCGSATPLMVARLGRAAAPAVRSSRYETDHYLLQAPNPIPSPSLSATCSIPPSQ